MGEMQPLAPHRHLRRHLLDLTCSRRCLLKSDGKYSETPWGRLVDPNNYIELDNLRPDPSFYISQQLGAEALSVYTQENAFTANVCSNYRDIYLIRKKIAKGTWDRAKFRNPGQPRRHRLIPRKAGTAQLPGSRLVTSRAWTAADLAYTSGKLRTTRRSFLSRHRCAGAPER